MKIAFRFAHIIVAITWLFVDGIAVARTPVEQTRPLQLTIDARNIQFRVAYATMKIPVKPGPVTLCYPKWVPGMHRVGGPISNLAGIKMFANGKSLRWERDAEDGFSFHCTVPKGCDTLEVRLAYAVPRSSYQTEDTHGGIATTSNMAVINWNALLLYPKGAAANELIFEPSLRLPPEWKFGTALFVDKQEKGEVRFKPVSLTELNDSPILAGSELRSYKLTDGPTPHFLIVTGEQSRNLDAAEQLVKPLQRLIAESNLLFGNAPFRRYHFLLHLSNQLPLSGLEHHESTVVGEYASSLTSKSYYPRYLFMVLAHEYVHSWNGKHRRPKGMVVRDFQQPHRTGMLWVYEGLTQYLGQKLSVRAGSWDAKRFRETTEIRLGEMAFLRKRDWRPLADAATSSPFVARPFGSAWRTRNDYYDEGALLWLQVDALIHKLTKGKKSLDGFCKRFFNSPKNKPSVRPYLLKDIVADLQAVAKHDWHAFLTKRLYASSPQPMLKGMEATGWRLKLLPKKTTFSSDFRFSLGMRVSFSVGEVLPDSPAANAGIQPSWILVSVNKQKKTNTQTQLEKALTAAKENGDDIVLEFRPEFTKTTKTVTIKYRGGNRHPWLVRIDGTEDVLEALLRPRAAERPLNKP